MAAMGKRERNERGIKNEEGEKGPGRSGVGRTLRFKVARVSISDT